MRDPRSKYCHFQVLLFTTPPTAPSAPQLLHSSHHKSKPHKNKTHPTSYLLTHTLSPATPTEPHISQPAPPQTQTILHDTAAPIVPMSYILFTTTHFQSNQTRVNGKVSQNAIRLPQLAQVLQTQLKQQSVPAKINGIQMLGSNIILRKNQCNQHLYS